MTFHHFVQNVKNIFVEVYRVRYSCCGEPYLLYIYVLSKLNNGIWIWMINIIYSFLLLEYKYLTMIRGTANGKRQIGFSLFSFRIYVQAIFARNNNNNKHTLWHSSENTLFEQLFRIHMNVNMWNCDCWYVVFHACVNLFYEFRVS